MKYNHLKSLLTAISTFIGYVLHVDTNGKQRLIIGLERTVVVHVVADVFPKKVSMTSKRNFLVLQKIGIMKKMMTSLKIICRGVIIKRIGSVSNADLNGTKLFAIV